MIILFYHTIRINAIATHKFVSEFLGKSTIDMNSYGGWTFGGVYGLQLANSTPLWLEAGLLYSEKGGKNNESPYEELIGNTKKERFQKKTTRLIYLQAPVVIKYAFDVADDFYI